MTPVTLTLWGKGSVTLPKEWRDQFPTKHFIAVEQSEGLLIKPLLDVEYYENKDGSFGLRFPMGIEAGALLKRMKRASKKIDASSKKKQ